MIWSFEITKVWFIKLLYQYFTGGASIRNSKSFLVAGRDVDCIGWLYWSLKSLLVSYVRP